MRHPEPFTHWSEPISHSRVSESLHCQSSTHNHTGSLTSNWSVNWLSESDSVSLSISESLVKQLRNQWVELWQWHSESRSNEKQSMNHPNRLSHCYLLVLVLGLLLVHWTVVLVRPSVALGLAVKWVTDLDRCFFLKVKQNCLFLVLDRESNSSY